MPGSREALERSSVLTPVPTSGEFNSLHLALAADRFYPVYAGPAIRFARYLPALSSRGIEIRVFTGTPNAGVAATSTIDVDWRSRRYGEMFESQSVHGVPITRVRVNDRAGWRRAFLFSRKLVDFCRRPGFRPEVIQLLSCDFTYVPALWRLKRLGIPTIFTMTLLPQRKRGGWKQAVRTRYLTQPLELVSCVVVSSEVMRKTLEEFRLRTPVRVIPNGVDTRRFRPAVDSNEKLKVRRKLGISPDDPVALFVGPLNMRKGVDLLLQAWSLLCNEWPRLQLILTGPGLERRDSTGVAFRQEVTRLASASGARDRIHFTGLVENVEEYMRSADLFVFTSRREGMPNVVPEAMASGLPVVMTPFVGLPDEFGAPDRQYVLADFEPDSIAAQMASLIRSRSRRAAIGRAARAWVVETLDVDHSIDRYARLYGEFASGKRRALRGAVPCA